MSLFHWDERYSVGVAEFDSQHKQLLLIMDQLARAIVTGNGIPAVAPAIDSLLEYTRTHFTLEEQTLLTHQYPGYAAQKAAHDNFIAQVIEFQTLVASGRNPTLQAMQFLRDWLLNHIQKLDKAYMAFLHAQGVS